MRISDWSSDVCSSDLPARLEGLMNQILERRDEWVNQRRQHVADLERRATEAEAKIKRLYDAIENGVIDVSDPSTNAPIGELTTTPGRATGSSEAPTASTRDRKTRR